MIFGADGLPEVTRIHPNLLFAGGPRANGGRFTPIGGPEALYLASSERTANAEWEAGLKSLFSGAAASPKTVFHTQVKLFQVLDVTLPENQTLLGTDPGELASEWKLLTDPPTQRLGLTAYETGCFSETPSFTSPMVVSEFRFNEIPR